MAHRFSKVFQGEGMLLSGNEDTGVLYMTKAPTSAPINMRTKADRKTWEEWRRWRNTGIALEDMIPEEMHGKDIKYKISIEVELIPKS
jgi:hypothetical protein